MKKGEYIPFNMLKISMKTTKIPSDSLKKTRSRRRRRNEKWRRNELERGGGDGGVLYYNFTIGFTDEKFK
jgi:hypothetical protein